MTKKKKVTKKNTKKTSRKKIQSSKQTIQPRPRKQDDSARIADSLQNESRLWSYFDSGLVSMVFTSLDNDWLLYNDTFLNLTGYSSEELETLTWKDLTHPEDLDMEFALFTEMIEGKRDSYTIDKRMILKGGKIIYVMVSFKLVKATSELPDHVVAMVLDVTERKIQEQALIESEARSQEAQHLAHLGFWEWNLNNDDLYWSDETFNVFGFEKDGYVPTLQGFIDILHPDDMQSVDEALKNSVSNGVPYDIGYRCILPNGKLIYAHAYGQVDYDNAGEPFRMLGTVMDVSETKLAEEALRSSEERYRALFDDNPTMIFTLDLDGTIISLNRFGIQQLGYPEAQLVGSHIEKIFYGQDIPIVREWIQRCIDEPNVIHRWELRKIRADGNILWVRETARLVKDIEGRQIILIVCEDITETKELSEQLAYQASHDALTSLLNRREFEIRLQRILETAKSDKSEHALCYLDLDQFKIINDTCGHVAGDELLRQIGTLLQSDVRQRDTLARLGGDEFGVLMEHCSLKHAERAVDKLRQSIEGFKFAWKDRSFPIGVSIGLVPITSTSISTIELMIQADAACYAAKDMGRNRIHVYHEEDTELARRHGEMQWVSQINHAIEHGKLRLFFQQIAPLTKKREGEHYELLLRMVDENQKLILPGAFLGAAERYNLSTQIDRWVFDHYIDRLMKYPEHINNLFQCSINLSALSLGDEEFLHYLVRRFDETNIPPDKICFEITETAAISNFSSAVRFIQTLKAKGCRFSLDDFGSGLSSFAYLKNLPVDYLKIDGMFVKDIDKDPIDFAMVKSISDIGNVMGKLTIAEFVENKTILKQIKKLGIDYAQGYEINSPEPIENILN
jgi:diguanylate cyclase (GGDEF)-like protein/PAS domain S-box-containing protein